MSRLRNPFARRSTVRASRAASRSRLREERDLRRAMTAAPTVESAHEIAGLIARH